MSRLAKQQAVSRQTTDRAYIPPVLIGNISQLVQQACGELLRVHRCYKSVAIMIADKDEEAGFALDAQLACSIRDRLSAARILADQPSESFDDTAAKCAVLWFVHRDAGSQDQELLSIAFGLLGEVSTSHGTQRLPTTRWARASRDHLAGAGRALARLLLNQPPFRTQAARAADCEQPRSQAPTTP